MQYDRHVPGVFDRPPSIVDDLPPIERAVFFLHAIDGKGYEEIARRLAIIVPAINEFLAEALVLLDAIRHGDVPERHSSPVRRCAEASLRARFRAYCEARLLARGVGDRIEWRADEDEDVSVSRAILASLRPVDLETFLLSRVDGFSFAQIARRMGTFQWVVGRRMVRAIAGIHQRHCSFEDWLIRLGREAAPGDVGGALPRTGAGEAR
ncbi:sigma factor-like helix-turn-helix DNA-binding protein [Sphingomonas oryzagri]